jgi:PAS domain S-box-containing protein
MDSTRILVVEDEAIVAMDLRYKLEALGYTVPALSYSGEEAVDLADELSPDLVLMDIRLNGTLDGIDAAARIRERLDIPVVYLTAYADDSTIQRAKITEPFGYLLKPVENKELQTAVEISVHKHHLEKELKASERLLSTILASSSDAVVAAGPDGNVLFMNPVAEGLLGWLAGDALGKNLVDIFAIKEVTPSNPDKHPVAKALEENRSVELAHETELISNWGEAIPVNGGAAPIRDQSGALTGLVLTFRDITLRKRAENEVAVALSKAKEADRLKSQLLSTVSHELHTPLAAIKGFTTTLLDNDDRLDQTEKLEFLQEIDDAADRLTSLIDHLLQFSRLEAGMLPIDPVTTHVDEVIEGALAHFRLRAPERTATMEIPEDLGPVLVDPRRLREVLDNLLDNALKYTPSEASIWIECCQMIQNQQPVIRIEVRDDGPGIPEEQIERIFEPFHQSSGPAAYSGKGVGLGLAICRHIIGAHHGSLTAEHVAGRGVAFVIVLPAASATGESGFSHSQPRQPELYKEEMAHPHSS